MLQWLFVESSQSVTRNIAGIGLSEVQFSWLKSTDKTLANISHFRLTLLDTPKRRKEITESSETQHYVLPAIREFRGGP